MKITYQFTKEETQIILDHLQEGKHKEVDPLIRKILVEGQKQIDEQKKQAETPKEE